MFKDAVHAVCTEISSPDLSMSPLSFFLDLLVKGIPSTKGTKHAAKQYFELIIELWPRYIKDTAAHRDVVQPKTLLDSLIKGIQEHTSEETSTASPDDSYTIGHLGLMSCIIEHNPELASALKECNMIDFLVTKCLFTYEFEPYSGNITKMTNLTDYKAKHQNMCHGANSRGAAYNLILRLCQLDGDSLVHLVSKYWSSMLGRV